MSSIFTFRLPVLPPSTNNCYPDNARGHGRHLSAEGDVFKQYAGKMAAAAAAAAGWVYHPGDRLALAMYLTPADSHRWDIDGRVKILQDAISEACGFDDTCIDCLQVMRIPAVDVQTLVTVECFDMHIIQSIDRVYQAMQHHISTPPGAATLIGEQLIAGMRQAKEQAKAARQRKAATS